MAALPACQAALTPELPAGGMRAMTIFFYGQERNRYDPVPFGRELDRLAALGANTIVLVPYWFQDDAAASQIAPTARTIADADFEDACRLVLARPLSLGIKPHIDVADGTPRAEIRPDDFEAWGAAYRRFIMHYAEIGHRTQADLFCIGTELTGTSGRRSFWKQVASECRRIAPAALTYSPTPQEALSIQFWGELDFIGVNAYFPISQKADPELGDLLAGWAAWAQLAQDLSHTYGKRVLATEIGYRNIDGAAADPGNFSSTGAPNERLQADLYRAALLVTERIDILAGVVWWQWELDQVGGPGSVDYTPRGKLAEEVLKEFWQP